MHHPQELYKAKVELFLNYLALYGSTAASTQNQALKAPMFLYREVLDKPLPDIDSNRAKKTKRLPVTLAPAEVSALLKQLSGMLLFLVWMLFGSGLRVNERLLVRVIDLGSGRKMLLIRYGKGCKG